MTTRRQGGGRGAGSCSRRGVLLALGVISVWACPALAQVSVGGSARDLARLADPDGQNPAGIKAPAAKSPVVSENYPVPGQWITALTRDLQGRIWGGSEDKGVFCFDPAASPKEQWRQFTTKDGLGDDNGYALACDKLGRIWVGQLNHGVSVFNGRKWRNYDIIDGPIGERVFNIKVCPVDGDVWIATSAGLTRYSVDGDRWRYYTRADGLVSDQVQALAFDKDGNLYAASQCDGLMRAERVNGEYKTWTVTAGTDQMPNLPSGNGLPTNLLNDVLVARDGSVWLATTTGLAWSTDRGRNWQFTRGKDWVAKVKGLYKGPKPERVSEPVWLAEDYVTCLGEDPAGRLWIGFRQKGYQVYDPPVGEVMRDSERDGVSRLDYVFCLLPLSKESAVLGGYAPGLYSVGLLPKARPVSRMPLASLPLKTSPESTASTSQPEGFPPLPKPAAPPTLADLNKMLEELSKVPLVPATQPDPARPLVVALNDDWRTQGDWLGRYGRYWACICATCAPSDYIWGAGPEPVRYAARIGPNCDKGDSIRYHVEWLYTTDKRVLELPPTYMHSRVVKGYTTWDKFRRQSEWDDHGEVGPMTRDGPHIYCTLQIPAGQFYLSLNFLSKDGHSALERYRDYRLSIRPHHGKNLRDIAQFDNQPELARSRVRDFWGGAYKRFLVQGPCEITIQVNRNNSRNAVISAVFLDLLDETPVPYFSTKDQWERRRVALDQERQVLLEAQRNPATSRQLFKPAATSPAAAGRVYEEMRRAAILNAFWGGANARRFCLPLLRCNTMMPIGATNDAERYALANRLTTCSYHTGLLTQWEGGQQSLGLKPAREIEKALRWDGKTYSMQRKGNATVTKYVRAFIAPKLEGVATTQRK